MTVVNRTKNVAMVKEIVIGMKIVKETYTVEVIIVVNSITVNPLMGMTIVVSCN